MDIEFKTHLELSPDGTLNQRPPKKYRIKLNSKWMPKKMASYTNELLHRLFVVDDGLGVKRTYAEGSKRYPAAKKYLEVLLNQGILVMQNDDLYILNSHRVILESLSIVPINEDEPGRIAIGKHLLRMVKDKSSGKWNVFVTCKRLKYTSVYQQCNTQKEAEKLLQEYKRKVVDSYERAAFNRLRK